MLSVGNAVGIDFGSRTTKIVEVSRQKVESFLLFDTDHESIRKVKARIDGLHSSRIAATGYGRHFLKARLRFSNKVITEIKACARGVHAVNPDCRLVIDVGGQDFKVITVNPGGGFGSFETNDRCAAGTGRFLEVMARVLGYDIEVFWREALSVKNPISINSMCTVFAESETISLLTAGKDRRRIALGLHQSVVDRIFPSIFRLEWRGEVMMVGGVAKNTCIVELLQKKLKCPVHVPDNPQIVSALGAALIAMEG